MRKAQRGGWAFPFVHWFNCNKSSETQLYFWEIFDVVCFEDCGRVLNRCRGLTRFWAVPVVPGRQTHISKARCGATGIQFSVGTFVALSTTMTSTGTFLTGLNSNPSCSRIAS